MHDATQAVDVAVIGGGIVGLAAAYQLSRRVPGRKIVVLEKEQSLAQHQTGRNSGVIHSGVYYKPGSLKARNCREGKLALESFCQAEGVAYETCGKVIVAVNHAEIPALQRIYERGVANGVECALIGRERLKELEPHAAGVGALHVPEAGIVDYPGVCTRLAERIRESGGEIVLGARVLGVNPAGDALAISTTAGDRLAKQVVNCAGLHSDRVARMTGAQPDARIVPFRGEYYELHPSAHHLCKNLIYPVPDPRFPFLGVHFTRMVLGGVECGPNAVLAFAREGYRKSDVNLTDLADALTYPGFLRMAARHWRMGLGEIWRSISKRAFVRALQRLIPEIKSDDLEPAPAGVRAQAVTREGGLVDDFLFVESERVLNVCNAPSPAATASLAIGQAIAERVAPRLP